MGQPIVAVQPREKRIHNFGEVSLGYPKKLALEEARRCPQCSDPVCKQGCPLGVDIPGFIRLLREGHAQEALAKIKEENPLPGICGRICSAPCESVCVLSDEHAPIGIRALERYAADYGQIRQTPRRYTAAKGKRTAIIGSGPAGLTAAAALAQRGYSVTIFESLDKPGGVLRYGIPEFRVPKKVLDTEIEDIKALNIEIKTSILAGSTITIPELFKEGFLAVLLATGAGIPKFMDIPGANLGRVYYGEEFLMRVNLARTGLFSRKNPLPIIGEHIAVIGSGNTALDCARAAVRQGKKATLIFRRTEDEMLVRPEERMYGKEEGVHLEPLVRPVEILANQNGFVNGIKCIRMDYADPETTGRWQLYPVEGSEFTLDADTVIIAIGHVPNIISVRGLRKSAQIQSRDAASSDSDVALNEDGSITIDPQSGMTSLPGLFACGNVVTSAGPLVQAMASGKQAAAQIDRYLETAGSTSSDKNLSV